MSRQIDHIFVVRMLFPMVKAIARQDTKITVVGFEDSVEKQAEKEITQLLPKNVKFIPMNFRSGRRIINRLEFVWKLSRLIRDNRPDIIHVNALKDLLFTYIAVHISTFGKKRPAIIAMTHNPSIWEDPKRARSAARTIRLFADGFVSLATTNKIQLFNLGIPENRLVVIPNVYDPDQINPENLPHKNLSTDTKKTYRIIYVANICERKAQDVLIRAAALVLKKHSHIDFDLVGKVIQGEEEYAEKLYSLAREQNTHGHINFTGGVSNQEVMIRLANSDIFVFPSLSEMMPRAVIEALLAGKPIIASGVDGILDLIQNGRTGLLVQPGNEEELANAICELIENPSLANALGSAGQENVINYCSPERVGGVFLEFYQSIIEDAIE